MRLAIIRRFGLLAVATTLFIAAPAFADDDSGTALNERIKGMRVLKRGSIKQLRNLQVEVAGKKISIAALSRQLFREQDEITAELKRGRSGLLHDPVETSEVVELENSTVLVKTTKATVTDPGKLAAASPRFRKMRPRKRAKRFSASIFTGESKGRFAKFKRRIAKMPANHPLRIAAAQGDSALLMAIADGKGDVEITTTVVIPKRRLKITNGQIERLTFKNGKLDFKNRRTKRLKYSTEPETTDRGRDEKPTVTTSGEVHAKARFLTGYTIGDSFEWSRKWKFPSGYFRLTASAYYAFGLRAPIEVTATMTPRRIKVKGRKDLSKKYRVAISARTLDAGASFYKNAGLSSSKVYKGKELVLEAGFRVSYKVSAGWGLIKWHGGIGKDFDFGKNFKPPHGNDCQKSGSACGVDVWVPAEITRTVIKIGGKKNYIKGSGRIGFLLGGTGKIVLDYSSVFGNGTLRSLLRGTGKTRKKHTFSLDRPGATKTFVTDLPTLRRSGERHFGFKIGKPRYKWNMRVTPGVRADIEVRAGKWLDRTYTVGPIWLDALTWSMGTIDLPPHRGTDRWYRNKNGTKKFVKTR